MSVAVLAPTACSGSGPDPVADLAAVTVVADDPGATTPIAPATYHQERAVSGTPAWILFDGNGNRLARGSRINQSLHDAVAAAIG